MTLWTLFLTFFKVGAFTFGGGLAMIALLEEEFVSKRQWIDREEFLDMVAIAESTPGPVAINCATYIGYKVAKVWGAVLSTIAVCLPSFAIIYVISLLFDEFLSLEYVGYAFSGIRVCVIYLIISAGLKMWRGIEKNAFSMIIFAAVLTSMLCLSVFAVEFSSIFFILIAGAAGLCSYAIRKLKGGRR